MISELHLELKSIFYEYGLDVNEKYLDRYIKFCFSNFINASYYEWHHVLPYSIFPEYQSDKRFIVKMSARAHLIAHRMLVKALPGNHKAVQAVYYMTLLKKPVIYLRSKEFERLRLESSKIKSITAIQTHTGRVNSDETKQKMSESRLRLLEIRPDLKENQSIRNLGNKYNLGKKNSEETKLKRTTSWKKTVESNPEPMKKLLEKNHGNKYAEGCKWMFHPEKQLSTLVPPRDFEMRISYGWLYGRRKFKKVS